MNQPTVSVKKFDGIPVTIPNQTTEHSPHWYLSYNNYNISDYGSDTTALVIGQMEYCIVLSGNHIDALQSAIDNRELFQTKLGVCLEYIRQHKDQLNKHSDPLL